MPIAIYLAGLAVKLGEAVEVALDIVNAFPRSQAGASTSIERARLR